MKIPKAFRKPTARSFSMDDFRTPPSEYAPVYGWCWNGRLERGEIDRQFAEMQRLGIRAFYILPEPTNFRARTIPTTLEPDILTPEYLEYFAYVTEKAKKAGMQCWFYDEGGWPSGSAANRVLQKYPSLARTMLQWETRTLPAGSPYVPADDAVAAFLENRVRILPGAVFDSDTEICEYFRRTTLFANPYNTDFPDLTRQESTIRFTEEFHDKHAAYVPGHLGSTITAVFSDEATTPRPVPFSVETVNGFRERYGIDPCDYLPWLTDLPADTPDRVRVCLLWHDYISECFCRNYLLTERSWCNSHGMDFCGHLDNDDKTIGWKNGGGWHLLRALRCFDIPGIDVIWRQIYPRFGHYLASTYGNNTFFPRIAASAAEQNGAGRSLTESFGVYGNGMTFDEMRYVIHYQAVRGVNIYNPLLVPYARYDYQLGGESPYLIEDYGCYRHMAHFNRHLERLSYLTQLGRPDNSAALYIPMRDLWVTKNDPAVVDAYEKIAYSLESSQALFDIIDDDAIALASVANGILSVGRARYRSILLPPCRFLSDDARAKLASFTACGGTVYAFDKELADSISGALFTKSTEGLLPPPLTIHGETKKLRLSVRELDYGHIYLLFNEDDAPVSVEIPLQNPTFLLDLYTGESHAAGKVLHKTIPSGDLLCLIESPNAAATEVLPKLSHKLPLLDFTIQPTEKLMLRPKNTKTEPIDVPSCPVSLGNWREIVGEGFTGVCVYETRFAKPSPTASDSLRLDLGCVRYAAEVSLNGHPLGVRIFAPYIFSIPAELLKDENVLTISVSNTAANAYLHSDIFDQWEPWQLSPYFNREKTYDADSLPSGLYGPVTISF